MAVKSKILSRKRVNDILSDMLQYPLTIVTAPVGYGKTVAVRDFLESNHIKNLWVSLSGIGKSDEFFWKKLTDKISTQNPQIAEQLKARGFPTGDVQIGRILDMVREDREDKRQVVILDDYQMVETEEKNRLLSMLIQAEIPGLYVVIVARTIPCIPVVEMIMKSQAVHVDSSVFEFSKEEIRDYFTLMGFEANQTVLEDVYGKSGGWITAVYLLMSSMMQKLSLNAEYSIDDLLRNAIFDTYGGDVQDLLCKLSIFNEFTVEQARVVLNNDRLAGIMDRLYRQNAFVALEGKETYRFHRVFLEFLRAECKRRAIDCKPFYTKAGQWYIDHRDYNMAFGFLHLAGDYDKALAVMDSSEVYQLYEVDLGLINTIFKEADKALYYKYPMATLKYAFQLLANSDKQGSEGKALQEDLTHYFSEHEHPIYSRDRIMAEISITSTYTEFNNIKKMVEHHRIARELLRGERSLIRTKRDGLAFGSPHFSYTYYNKKGSYRKTVNLLFTQMEDYTHITGGCGMGCDFLSKAEYALETGDLTAAELLAFKAAYKAKAWEQSDILIGAKFALARIYILQGKAEDGLELMDELTEELGNSNSTINCNAIDMGYGYLYGCLGEYEKIPEWIRQGKMPVSRFKYQGTAFDAIAYGKAILLKGNYLEAEALIDSFAERFRVFNNQLGLIHNYIHSAIVKYHLYGIREAATELAKAFDIAKDDSVVMPFAENAAELMPILKSGKVFVPHEYYAQVLSMCNRYLAAKKKSGNQGSILTEREVEVLRYLAEGESQREIAEKLFLSPNTIRRHIQNIYLKLDANNKTIALKKAKELKILQKV